MIGIIGFGNMGQALSKGLNAQSLEWGALEKVQPLRQEIQIQGGKEFFHLQDLAESCSILVLAIKPQDMDEFLKLLKPFIKHHLVISIAAALSLDYYHRALDTKTLVRFMPNLGAKVGKSSVGVSFYPGLPQEQQEKAMEIARALGWAHVIPEKLQRAITGLSGSGIAFVFQFIQALALGGVKEGFPYPQALEIALETLEAGVATIKESGLTPGDMITKVTSPGGTTIEGIHLLESGAFTALVMDAVGAASQRAGELEK